jgi:hypothetical protein
MSLPIGTSLGSPPNRSDTPRHVPAIRARGGLTSKSWSPHAALTVADWVRLGQRLGALGRASGWWIGDWLRYGNARYGERYRAAARITGYDVQSLMNMAYVAGRFGVARRRENLSFSHHAEVASLPVEDQERWLDRASAAALSVRGLRSEVRQSRERSEAKVTSERLVRKRDDLLCPECGHRFSVTQASDLGAAGGPMPVGRSES